MAKDNDSERLAEAEDETSRLEARVTALEAELRSRERELASLRRERRQESRTPRERRDVIEGAREIFEHADDENRRFFKAVLMSQLEQLRLTADLMHSFADRVANKNQGDDAESFRELPVDLADTYLDTIDRSLDIPEKTLDTFREHYKRTKQTSGA